MIGNDAGELLPVIQADRDAAAVLYDRLSRQNWNSATDVHSAAAFHMKKGRGDGSPTVQAFARHRLSTPASAGVLVEAARALMARWPTDQHEGSPLYDEACALRQALSTTATPASDGVTCPDCGGSGDNPTPIKWPGRDCPTCEGTGKARTPDRFGEGYRAGVEASAKVADQSLSGTVLQQEILLAARIRDAIRSLQPATGGEA